MHFFGARYTLTWPAIATWVCDTNGLGFHDYKLARGEPGLSKGLAIHRALSSLLKEPYSAEWLTKEIPNKALTVKNHPLNTPTSSAVNERIPPKKRETLVAAPLSSANRKKVTQRCRSRLPAQIGAGKLVIASAGDTFYTYTLEKSF